VSVARFFGKGSIYFTRCAYATTAGKFKPAVPSARYLGPHAADNGSNEVEARRKATAAERASRSLRAFWKSTSNLRWKGIVFKCLVDGTRLSGLTSFAADNVLNKSIDTKQQLLARRAVLGTGCLKPAEGGGVFRAKSSLDILRSMSLVPASVSLAVLRMRWLQSMVKWPGAHVQVLAALFGTASWDANNVYDNDGVWQGRHNQFTEQLHDDLRRLAARSQFASCVDEVLEQPSRLFLDPCVREGFSGN